mmetsp:Transcript_105595/g.340536  ORF Transcript_105595/g.340536 Transcript_105595/m.340536 type:complete len:211 (-) Transcript_105595:328-960(-)
MLRTVHQEILVGVNCIWELVHPEEGVADVAHDLEADRLHVVGDLVESHAVHLDSRSPLLLLEVDVPHVHAEAPAERVLLVLNNLCVDRQRLVVVVVCLVLNREVQTNCIREVDIQLVEEVLLLPEAAELPLLLTSFLALLEGFAEVALLPGDGALLHEPVDLLLHLAELLLRGKLYLLLQGLCGATGVALVHRVEDTLLLGRRGVAGGAI